jgi:hypothetical protein
LADAALTLPPPAIEYHRRLFDPGPKRILALDGGGVRGIVALAFLERIEALLSERAGRTVVLADYFDLIGGTSTGAIIATGLSLGMPVARLVDAYLRLAGRGFRGLRFHGGLLVPKFRTAPLMAEIRRQVGDETLGSSRLRTGLAIVAKRIDTGSVWVFHNNPRGRFFAPSPDMAGPGSDAVPNRDLPLVQLIRASTAAPTFFSPQRIEIARGVFGTFIDGGVSPYNNPALLLFMLASLDGYGFRWVSGADRLLLISAGTGYRPLDRAAMPSAASPAATLAVLALRSVIEDCSDLAQTMLQWLGTSPAPRAIDLEIGDLSKDQLGPAPHLRYQRYDIELSRAWFERELDLRLDEHDIAALDRVDRPGLAPELLALARLAATRQIRPEHLPPAFDAILAAPGGAAGGSSPGAK